MTSFAESAAARPRPRVSLAGRRPSPPLVIATATLGVYLALVLGAIAQGHSAVSFAFVGRTTHEPTTTLARYAPPGATPGYDGQFALFIALDPRGARTVLDRPAYRYSHILYPMLARAVALDSPALVPAALLIVNLLAVAIGAFALARLLERRGGSPWLAFVVAFYPGMLWSIARDLNEPVAFAAVAVAMLVLDWKSTRRVVVATALFAAAALARETTLIFPLALAAWEAMRTRQFARPAIVALAAAPYALWSAALLYVLPVAGDRPPLAHYPLQGIIEAPRLRVFQWVFVVGPVLLMLAAVAVTVRRRPAWTAFTWILVAELALSCMLGAASFADWPSSSRLQIGALMATLLAWPELRARSLQIAAAGLAAAPAIPLLLFMFASMPR